MVYSAFVRVLLWEKWPSLCGIRARTLDGENRGSYIEYDLKSATV